MIAVLSATEDDNYATPLPFAIYSWLKLGFGVIVFIPKGTHPKLDLAKKYCEGHGVFFFEFECEEKRIPTYSQVIRLFGAACPVELIKDEYMMITADADMAVFSDFFKQLDDGNIHVVGNDLTPADQYPMCYCAMSVKKWREVMRIAKTAQQETADLIDPIEGLNIRGEQWSYDQWYLKKKLTPYENEIIFHKRSNGQNQFATKRADRDGWYFDPFAIIDAHLPRPLTDRANFNRVVELFATRYLGANLSWMEDYRNEYIKLL